MSFFSTKPQHVVQHHLHTNDVHLDPDMAGGYVRLNPIRPLMKWVYLENFVWLFLIVSFSSCIFIGDPSSSFRRIIFSKHWIMLVDEIDFRSLQVRFECCKITTLCQFSCSVEFFLKKSFFFSRYHFVQHIYFFFILGLYGFLVVWQSFSEKLNLQNFQKTFVIQFF